MTKRKPPEDVLAGGRPTGFKPEFCKQAEKLCALGATDSELAEFFEVSTRTIYRWQAAHPAFCHALKVAKTEADARVERSLYHRAVGYSFEAVKIMAVAGEVQKVPYTEHVPPDTTAMIFWLKNRQSDKWRDVHKHEVGAAGEFSGRTDDELRDIIIEHAGESGVGREGGSRAGPPPDKNEMH